MSKKDVTRGYSEGRKDATTGKASKQAYGDTFVGRLVDQSTGGPSDYGGGYREGYKDGQNSQN